MNLKFVEAEKKDRDFIIFANQQIDLVSGIVESTLKKNIDEDLLRDKKAVCLIAKDEEKQVGMVLFSKVYWADRGQGAYVSQAYIHPDYRKKGVFKSLLQNVFTYFEGTQFITLLVAKENIVMQKCVEKLNFELEDMLSFVVNKNNFDV